MAWQSAMSMLSSPARSAPNRIPARPPAAISACRAVAELRAVRTGSWVSRGRAVEAWTRLRSAMAAATVGNTSIPSTTQSAPEAEA